MPDFPAEFPGAWQNMPIEVRRFLTLKLVEKSLVIHEGPEGLVKWLYAGRQHLPLSVKETYAMRGRDFWPLVVAETNAWLDKRKQANPSGDAG